MQKVGDVNLKSYTAVHTDAYYGDVAISLTGSVRPTEPLTDDIVSFLESIGVNLSIWNGSKGVLGRAYISTPSSEQQEMSSDGLHKLRSRYIDVKRSLYIDATRQQLGRELETQTKLQKHLDGTVVETEQKIRILRKKLNTAEVRKGERDLHDSLSKALEKNEAELSSSKRAEEAIRRKVLQTQVDITENETGFLRRFAILRTIFGEKSSWREFTVNFYKNGDDLESRARSADKESREVWTKALLAKRFYVDAKMGLAHLYRVENSLKCILENLVEAMKSQKGTPSQQTSSLPSPVGVEYRLGYVRQLWATVDPAFQAALPYIAHTSLRDGDGFIAAERPPDNSDNPFDNELKDYGTFMNAQAILPSFSKIELAHPLSKTSRIAALHKGAASGYKLMNTIYDSQEAWIKRAVGELKDRKQEERDLNDNLIAMWERLLAIDTQHM